MLDVTGGSLRREDDPSLFCLSHFQMGGVYPCGKRANIESLQQFDGFTELYIMGISDADPGACPRA
jgi:hypothetical protein